MRNGGQYTGTSVRNIGNTDFTFCYCEWDNTLISGNTIEEENPDISLLGYAGGIEIHASGITAIGNKIVGCNPGMYLASTNPGVQSGILVSGNSFEKCSDGIHFDVYERIVGVTIDSNYISVYAPVGAIGELNGIKMSHGSTTEWSPTYANAARVESLTVRRNTITCSLPSGSMILANGLTIHSLWHAKIQNNTITRLTKNAFEIFGSPWGMVNTEISDNDISNCGLAYPEGEARKAGFLLSLVGHATIPELVYMTDSLLIRNNTVGNVGANIRNGGLQCGLFSIDMEKAGSEVRALCTEGQIFAGIPQPMFNYPTRTTVAPESLLAKTAGVMKGQGTPAECQLSQNYPNPFNASTRIHYTLLQAGNAVLEVYDTLGRLIARLVDGPQSAGEHEIVFDAGNLSSGIYLFRLQSGNATATKKMLLVR